MVNKKRKNILIIINPVAGRRLHNKFSRIVNELKRNNLTVTVIETLYSGHGRLIAEQNINDNYDMIVAAGGDGTINEVINGIYPHQMPFGIIPLGTANVLAREIKLKNNVEDITDCIIKGHMAPCYLGVSSGQYFSLMISTGLDAMSVAYVNIKLKKIIGKAAYVMSFLWEIIKSKNITYEVIENGKKHIASNVIISNGRFYGGQYICAPEARLEDEGLYLLMAKKTGRFNSLKYAYLMLTQQYPDCDSVITVPVTKVTIKCAYKETPVQIDGDYGGYLPAEISISDQSINLVQPLNTSNKVADV